jgi:hypothetical protein
VQVAGDVEAQREPENVTGAEPVERHLWCVALQQAEVFLQHLAERPIRSPCSIREAAAGATERLGLLICQLLPELAYESRLPDTRIAEDGHKPGSSLLGNRRVSVEEALQLMIATDKRLRQAADSPRPHE